MSGRAPPIIPFDHSPTTREVTLSDLRSVQSLERKSYEARMTLESNANILSSLRDFYENLVENSQLSIHINNLEKWSSEQKDFARSLKYRESEIHRFETRCNRLVQLTADQRNLVCHCSDFTKNSADSSPKYQVIKQLEFQSSRKMERLSFETFFLGKLAQKEAVAVRIITIVSLIYLPCSVVSVSSSIPFSSFRISNQCKNAVHIQYGYCEISDWHCWCLRNLLFLASAAKMDGSHAAIDFPHSSSGLLWLQFRERPAG